MKVFYPYNGKGEFHQVEDINHALETETGNLAVGASTIDMIRKLLQIGIISSISSKEYIAIIMSESLSIRFSQISKGFIWEVDLGYFITSLPNRMIMGQEDLEYIINERIYNFWEEKRKEASSESAVKRNY